MGEIGALELGLAFLGGTIAGIGLAIIDPEEDYLRATLWHALLVLWLGALYFVGRLIVGLTNEDPEQVGRIIGAAVRWGLFSVAVIPAGLATYWGRSRGDR